MPRFIVSHRLSGKADTDARKRSRDALDRATRALTSVASVAADHQPPAETRRRTMIVEADARDIDAMCRQSRDPDLIVEAEALRRPAVFAAAELVDAPQTDAAGVGAAVDVAVTCGGAPVDGAVVTILLQSRHGEGPASAQTTTDKQGRGSAPYDPRWWVPGLVTIVPREGCWGWQITGISGPVLVDLPALPETGPLGWWHLAMGVNVFQPTAGSGVRIGIADTGAGPHPFLSHVRSAGAFVNGGHDASPNAGLDVDRHGTHVAGIIGARPENGAAAIGGMAPGADVVVARVYAEAAGHLGPAVASNGDIANALDQLAHEERADIINLSLGGAQPSAVEADAVDAALDGGALVVCAAGNGSGAPVMYPAADPGAVAVSAVGTVGVVPDGSVDAIAVPWSVTHFAANGVYVASFANTGPQIACVAPGVGVISTVPGTRRSYAAMSGTSMAAPAVVGALALLLEADAQYRRLPASRARAQRAWALLRSGVIPLGLDPQLQGYGFATVLSRGFW